jgi:hypothetical protein
MAAILRINMDDPADNQVFIARLISFIRGAWIKKISIMRNLLEPGKNNFAKAIFICIKLQTIIQKSAFNNQHGQDYIDSIFNETKGIKKLS